MEDRFFRHFLAKYVLLVLLILIPLGIQAQNVRLKGNSVPLRNVIQQVEKQTNLTFDYDGKIVDISKVIAVNNASGDITKVLPAILKGTGYECTFSGKHIILSKIANRAQANPAVNNKIEVKGHVTDSKGEPIVGALITEKGTQNKTVTDLNGNYSLDASEGSQLVISYLGSKNKVIPARRVANAELEDDAENLQEVVVVGYGTQKKVNLTGAVTAIDSKQITDRKVAQTSMALQGIAPGVTITQRSGQPGADAGSIRIRGVGTLNNSDPLVLVDGVESDINTVDAVSIESISILKDAASSSIYGSKAANGVILITTKRAAEGNFNISYSGYLTKQSATRLPNKVDAIDHMKLLNEAKINAGAGAVYTDEQIKEWETLGPSDRDHYPDTDWQDAVLKGNGIQQSHSITLQGGTDKLRAFASFNYLNQNAIIKSVNYERYSLRLNTDYYFSKKFSTSLDIYAYYAKNRDVAPYSSNSSNGSGIGYVFYLMNKLPAVQAVKYSNGLYAEGQNGENPVAFIEQGGFKNTYNTPITANFTMNWKPIEGLDVKGVFSQYFAYPRVKSMVNKVNSYNPDGSLFTTLPSKSLLTESSDFNRQTQTNITATYQKKLGAHDFKVMGGMQYENSRISNFWASRNDVIAGFSELQSGSVDNQKNDGSASEYTLMSHFGRINYSFMDKYLLEANIRYDGSSKFAKGNRWGAFPSVSVGWRISEEKFWEPVKDVVPNLKLRASYGTLGNQNINSYYPFASNVNLTTTYISNDQLQSGGAITVMSNPDITWETTHMTDIGVDANLFNKLNITFDWYYKKTKDILMTLDIPGTMGVEPTYQNAGVVRNIGWDLTMSYADHIGDFHYNVGFNLSDVKNKIINMKGINGTGLVTNREGYSINSLYMLKSLGILSKSDFDADGNYLHEPSFRKDLAPGDLRFADLDNSGTIDDNDREVLGSTIPRYTYGISLYGEYKGFDLNILLQGVGKVDGYLIDIQNPFFSGGTIFDFHKDRWTTDNPNPNAKFPRMYFNDRSNNYRPSDFYLKSAAYLRLKNLQIGYSLPTSALKVLGIRSLRVYFVGENLFTITGFWKGWDPEAAPGSGGGFYPQVKNLGFGMDIKF